MKSLCSAIMVGLFSSVGFAADTSEQVKVPTKKTNNEIARCIYSPVADQQSSSLPTEKIGFKFLLEVNNNNEITVDSYKLTDDLKPVKQIGHAELVNATQSTATKSSAADFLQSLTLAEDSPFDFAISFTESPSTQAENKFLRLWTPWCYLMGRLTIN